MQGLLSEQRLSWASKVFIRCFKTETERLLSMEDLWEKRKKPVSHLPTKHRRALLH